MCSGKPWRPSVRGGCPAVTSGLAEGRNQVIFLVLRLTFMQFGGIKPLNLSESQFLTGKMENVPLCTVIIMMKNNNNIDNNNY